MVAETLLREIGRPTLVELLELTALIAQKDSARFERVAARWIFRYLQEADGSRLEDVTAVAGCLHLLGGSRHDEALLSLRGMSEAATSRARQSSVR